MSLINLCEFIITSSDRPVVLHPIGKTLDMISQPIYVLVQFTGSGLIDPTVNSCIQTMHILSSFHQNGLCIVSIILMGATNVRIPKTNAYNKCPFMLKMINMGKERISKKMTTTHLTTLFDLAIGVQ